MTLDKECNDKVRRVLRPLMACSVEQRYQLFYGTIFGKAHFSNLELEGSIANVCASVAGTIPL